MRRDEPGEGPFDLVAVGPHPDDVEIFAGGTVASAVAHGHRVALLDLTRGEMASRGTVAVREAEAAAAARELGVAWRENLGLPDAGLDANDAEQVAALVAALRRLRPRTLLVPWREERHPDHVAAHQLVLRAVFLAGLRRFEVSESLPPCPEPEVLFYLQRVEARWHVLVDISAQVDTKRRAIAAHVSQVGPASSDARAPAPLIGSSEALAALEARDRYLGAMAGCAAAEALRSRSALVVDDPLALVAPGRRRHFFPPGDGA